MKTITLKNKKNNFKKGILLSILFFHFSITLFAQGTAGCWREISAGQNFTLAIKSDGTMWGWGANGNLLGLNGNMTNQSAPIQIGTANDWMTVSAGANHSLAIKTNGTLWAWGSGVFGQLGNGAFNNATWTVTQMGTANDWIKVSAGSAYSLAIKNTGTLWAWGLNTTGQLGIGNLVNQNLPTQVGTSSTWSDIEAGHEHALALDNLGFIWAWGNNTFGQLGNGTNTTSLSPIQITTSPSWIDISAGFDHSLFINAFGFIFSCGNNSNGQLGDGTNTASNVLIPMTSTGTQFQYIAVSAGQKHSLAIQNNGTLSTCGLNNQGQLGLGNFANTSSLTQVGTGTNWFAISAGFVHSEAMETTTNLWSTGRGLEGQLGVGSFTNSNILVMVNCPTSLSNEELISDKIQATVYPNPTNTIVNIEYSIETSGKIIIQVTNIQGQIINEMKVERISGLQRESIDLSNKSNGMYFITLTTESSSLTSKVVKN